MYHANGFISFRQTFHKVSGCSQAYGIVQERMAKLLVVEDKQGILDVVEFILAERGYEVVTAMTGEVAMAQLDRHSFDLIVLDLGLPDATGFSLFHQTRQANPHIPVIILTAQDNEIDRVVGLEAGADDYVTKPFSNRELVARVGAVLRRVQGPGTPQLFSNFGPLSVDHEALRVTYFEQAVNCTANEYRILEAMTKHPARNFTREGLLDVVYDADVAVTSRSIDAAIMRIRQKLATIRSEPNPIESVYGVGYKLNPELERTV